MKQHSLKQALIDVARREGFDDIGITAPQIAARNKAALSRFIEAGWHGDMGWMEEKQQRRLDPAHLWPDAKSIIMLAMNYGPGEDPLPALERRSNGVISVYAQGKDYHDIIKKKLKNTARWLVAETGAEVKVFVDTAPVMEKPLGMTAGIGWQGKHTNLVNRQLGSWIFLGAIFTTHPFEPDASEVDHCGSCKKCLTICPTDAFPAPYQLDARRCISYLTIEHKGPIPRALRPAIGNRIYGCDDCLAICPWNKFAVKASEQRFQGREGTKNPPLAELLAMDDDAFRARFKGTPIKRTGRDRFLRNCLIAAGNGQDKALAEPVARHLQDENPLLRGAAIWAYHRLAEAQTFTATRQNLQPKEHNKMVLEEWQATESEQA